MDDLDKGQNHTVRDIGLADKGALLVDWARARMPVLAKLKEEAERTGISMHKLYYALEKIRAQLLACITETVRREGWSDA